MNSLKGGRTVPRRIHWVLLVTSGLLSLAAVAFAATEGGPGQLGSGVMLGLVSSQAGEPAGSAPSSSLDLMNAFFVFMLASFIGIGVIRRVSRLLHTPLMSLTNAISAIAVVGSIMVAGNPHYATEIRLLGAVALFASMTNIVSGFLITERMLQMFKERDRGKP
jgi:NAD(P) transhydrogenase subunit alpha